MGEQHQAITRPCGTCAVGGDCSLLITADHEKPGTKNNPPSRALRRGLSSSMRSPAATSNWPRQAPRPAWRPPANLIRGIAKTQLDSAKEWLAVHNDAVMTVLFLFGVVFIANGISDQARR